MTNSRRQSSSTASGTVYVIGAGFSAGLGFPLVNDLLIRLWDRLNTSELDPLRKVIAFHHPGFDPSRRTSFPNVEQLLSEIKVNDELFEASREGVGTFTNDDLENVQGKLLLNIASWFHVIQSTTMSKLPIWLKQFRDQILKQNDTIISFNWDLVLDELLFGDMVDSSSYGFVEGTGFAPVLLKPHGSLNWYRRLTASTFNKDLRFELHPNGGRPIYCFTKYREPRSSHDRTYPPLIVPPVYSKTFSDLIFTDLWKKCVSRIGTAKKVIFLGYSLPEADMHARFIFRCGFHNQIEGMPLGNGSRARATGPSHVVIVNPDLASAKRIEQAVGINHEHCDWQPKTVASWIMETAH